MNTDIYDDWAQSDYDPDRDCPRCMGDGKVPTADYESYHGALYKPCPACGGDPCVGEAPMIRIDLDDSEDGCYARRSELRPLPKDEDIRASK